MIWRKKEKQKAQYQFNSERVFLVATQPAKTAYSYFQTSSVGLSEEEIGQRQSAYGKNEISREQKKNPLVLFIRTFINPFIGVLTALAVISLVIDVVMARPEDREWTAVLIIISMVVCSAILRFWQEWKASEATDSLMKMVKNTCFVKRFSGSEEVDITELVPGDVVCLAAGDMIPADIRIIESKDLFVSQASLTGESDPVEKFPEINGRRHSHGSVIELDNICYMGSTVISGSAKGIVFGTGNDTYLGTIARSLVGERATTAFDKGISKVSFLLIRFMLVMVLFVFFVNGFTKGDWFEAFIFALSVAVGLTPEMLPMIVTANLSKGAVSMSKKKTVVKNLNAIQNFGAMNILCTDKTGTLTKAQPTLHSVIAFGEEKEDDLLCLAACLEEHFPHSMAKAVVDAATQKNLEHEEMHSKVEYIVAHGIASTINEKRAVIGSAHFVFEDENCVISEGEQAKFDALPKEYSHLYLAIEGKLAAVICIEDPLREEASAVVQSLKRAGLSKVVMMTGDSERTAAAIAKRVGVDEYYSEVLPEDKASFVEREKAAGRKVIMIGDGINDSPALSAANVGIAISDGAEIAREIADITVSSDDLYQIVTLKLLSDSLMERIKKNYRRIVGFNSLLIVLGVTGVIQPTTSALLHNSSTLLIGLESMQNLLD